MECLSYGRVPERSFVHGPVYVIPAHHHQTRTSTVPLYLCSHGALCSPTIFRLGRLRVFSALLTLADSMKPSLTRWRKLLPENEETCWTIPGGNKETNLPREE